MNPDLDELRSTQGLIRHIDVNNRVGNHQEDGSGTISNSPGAYRPFDGTLNRKQTKGGHGSTLPRDGGVGIIGMNIVGGQDGSGPMGIAIQGVSTGTKVKKKTSFGIGVQNDLPSIAQ